MINKIISVVGTLLIEAAILYGIGLLGSVVLNKMGIQVGIIDCALSLFGFACLADANVEVLGRFIKK